jgi:hypothetical protein
MKSRISGTTTARWPRLITRVRGREAFSWKCGLHARAARLACLSASTQGMEHKEETQALMLALLLVPYLALR